MSESNRPLSGERVPDHQYPCYPSGIFLYSFVKEQVTPQPIDTGKANSPDVRNEVIDRDTEVVCDLRQFVDSGHTPTFPSREERLWNIGSFGYLVRCLVTFC